jgi:hypothetical protein
MLLLLLLLLLVRGRGGRGGANNLGGGAFRTAQEFEQLQTAAYYVGGSKKSFNALNKVDKKGRRLAPPIRDQGLICHSCVGQAVASAIQLSLAFNLEFWETEVPPAFDRLVTYNRTHLAYDVDASTL